MSTFIEKIYISQFNIHPNGCISIRKTTDILKDDVMISSTYWRTMLSPSATIDTEVLDEPYYANLASVAWTEEIIAAYAEAQAAATSNIG
jgi:hypothetical protein